MFHERFGVCFLCCHSKWIIIRDGIFICSFLNELICSAHCVPLAVLAPAWSSSWQGLWWRDVTTTGNSTKNRQNDSHNFKFRFRKIVAADNKKLVESWCCDNAERGAISHFKWKFMAFHSVFCRDSDSASGVPICLSHFTFKWDR